jgi:hypothetical protein
MSETAVGGDGAAWRDRPGTAAGAAWEAPDTRRVLQLALGAVWLLDAVLQYQSFMFTRAFGQMLAATAPGNPAVIAAPITWNARLIEHHGVALNTVFATVQLLLALGIAWRPTVRLALGASIAWAIGVWWAGEGLGEVLTGNASPVSGAPGAVILYALLAVLLWPADRGGGPAPFTAARAVGARAARVLWLVLWASLAWFALQPGNRAPQGLHDMIAGMAAGEPGWLAGLDGHAAALVAHRGLTASIVLAITLALIAVGIYLPPPAARACLVLAVLVAAVIWAVGEAFGAIFTGGGTDPNSGPLLALLALAYWPASSAAIRRRPRAGLVAGLAPSATAPGRQARTKRQVRPEAVPRQHAARPFPGHERGQ